MSFQVTRAISAATVLTVLAGIHLVSTAAAEETIPVGVERAFPNLRLYRPLLITNPGDGTNRIVVGEQNGRILSFENNDAVKDVNTLLDIKSKVVYKDKQNEEGLLGLAFHPKFKENGQFFVYYTTTDAEHTSVISRFSMSKDDPNKADPESELELMRIKQPYWNHNGGTLVFGPDGYLYIGLGDGGFKDDPHKAGQDLSNILGKILRIDVDHKSDGKNYAIPKDNPFVDNPKARPEIFAYGVRNIWRMSFDRKTGELWAADVGQNLWEEINIVPKGGNLGWSVRESKHPFGADGAKASPEFVEPIWEYNHEVGKSITGGYVYRGKKVPSLVGKYVYADYVGGQVWALDYDQAAGKVVGNYLIEDKDTPVITFGEDEKGEVYFSSAFGMLYRFTEEK